jgi:hypothetical protein
MASGVNDFALRPYSFPAQIGKARGRQNPAAEKGENKKLAQAKN